MDETTQQQILDVFEKLPEPVKRAITSANTKKQLQTLAEEQKLHVDMWGGLENEVTLTLLGIQPVEELPQNLLELGLPSETVDILVERINAIVFEPIREELERELGAPQAKEEPKTDIEKIRDAVLAEEKKDSSVAPPPVSAPAVPAGPASGEYKPGEKSVERATVDDDPYREATK